MAKATETLAIAKKVQSIVRRNNLKTKSPLPWFGSDAGVAPELAAMLDHCNHVTIPFAGGLSILPHLKARAIVANDLHEHAIGFYEVLSGSYGDGERERLIWLCNKTLSHPSHLRRALQVNEDGRVSPPAERAWGYWAACWIGRKGKGGMKDLGNIPSVRRTAGGGTNATRIQSAAAGLDLWAKEFERCEFECDDFRSQILNVSERRTCGVYADPPWVGVGRNYLHKFTDNDHRDLANLLTSFNHSTIVVRYGDDPLIRELYQESKGWTWIEAESRTQANKVRGEVWIVRNHPVINGA